ncbi:MAG: flagellar motor protein MotB [Candidatus Eiseniibacteriota bacterium]
MSAPQAKPGTKGKGPPPATIIVKRVKKGGHDAHHGGAWKVAYADFVTAMMAFFLLLWLLNATTEEQRQGISNYFAPESVSYTKSGAGGVLGGLDPVKGEGVGKAASPQTMAVPVPRSSEGKDEAEIEREHGSVETQPDAPQDYEARRKKIDEEEARKAAEALEEKQFAVAEENLHKSIDAVPELKAFADNLMVDRTPEGLRIQLVDQNKTAMFPRGSAVMYDYTRELLKKIAEVIKLQTQPISIAGHTDSTPYADPTGYSNWELSADRANASRRVLTEAGVPAERITQVVGKADREPLIKDNPADARNRRITIVLLRQANLAQPANAAKTVKTSGPLPPDYGAPEPAKAPPPAAQPAPAPQAKPQTPPAH